MVSGSCQHLSAFSSYFSIIPHCIGRRSVFIIYDLHQYNILLAFTHLGPYMAILRCNDDYRRGLMIPKTISFEKQVLAVGTNKSFQA